MEFKSEFYDSFDKQTEKYGIDPQSARYSAAAVQPTEEMLFGWTNFLIS